jgi:hypothetical protein
MAEGKRRRRGHFERYAAQALTGIILILNELTRHLCKNGLSAYALAFCMYWDGRAAGQIAVHLRDFLQTRRGDARQSRSR